MPCPYGSEPKPGDLSPVTMKFRDIIDLSKVKREDLSYAGGGLIDAWDIGTFCQSSSEASHQPVRGVADSITRAYNAVVDEKWNARCKCKPPPEMFPVDGGQCRTFYNVVVTGTFLDYQPPHAPRNPAPWRSTVIGPVRVDFFRFVDGSENDIEHIRVGIRDGDGNRRTQVPVEPAKPGTGKITVSITRFDGLPDLCGNQRDTAPYDPNLPPGLVFAPLDPEAFCPPCQCDPPGTLFVPTPIPVPPIIIPVPVPIPFPLPPLPCPPCVCPEPPPPPPPPPPKPPEPPKVDCCPEILSRLTRIQSDVSSIRDVDIPGVEDHFDKRLDGLIECLDFNQYKLGQERSLGSGVTGTVELPARTIAVKLTATTPAPANKSKRQDGGGTPDVIQGGWCWFRYGGGMYLRTPLDAETKLIAVPSEFKALSPLGFQWRGVHQIAYNVIAITAPDRASPPYEERPCQD